MRICLLLLDDDFIGSESDEDIGWQDDFVSILGTAHVIMLVGTYLIGVNDIYLSYDPLVVLVCSQYCVGVFSLHLYYCS